MARHSPETVEATEDYIHVRFRDPDEFDTIRTPDWASDAADSVTLGTEVRTGKHPDADGWAVQSVLVPASVGTSDAESVAERVLEKIES